MIVSNYSPISLAARSDDIAANTDPHSITVFFNNKVVKCIIESSSNNIILNNQEGREVIAQISSKVDDLELQRLSKAFFNAFNGDYVIAKKLLDWVSGLIYPSECSVLAASEAFLPKTSSFLTCKAEMIAGRAMAVVHLNEDGKEPSKLSARTLYRALRYEKKPLIFDSRFEFNALVEYLEQITGISTAEKAKVLIESYLRPPLTNSQYIASLLTRAVKGDKPLFNSQGFRLKEGLFEPVSPASKRSCISEDLILRNIKNILPPSS